MEWRPPPKEKCLEAGVLEDNCSGSKAKAYGFTGELAYELSGDVDRHDEVFQLGSQQHVMERRELLTMLGVASIPVVAGCLGASSRSHSTTTAHTVSVTREIVGPGASATRQLQIDNGAITISLTCPEGETQTTQGDIPSEEWDEFERFLLETDVGELAGSYTCSGDCPKDASLTRLTITVDNQTSEIEVEAAAERPPQLIKLQSRIDDLAEYVDRPTCD